MASKKSATVDEAPAVLGAAVTDAVEAKESTGPAETPAAAPKTPSRAKLVYARLKPDYRWSNAQIGSHEFTKQWTQVDPNSPFYGEWLANEILEFGDEPE